jgi:uncharacterized membrane protein
MLLFLCLFSACASHPPVQAMAEARLAIETAKNIAVHTPNAGEKHIQQAEQALKQASAAVNAHQFELAHSQARQAKHYAQAAARERNKAQKGNSFSRVHED